MLFDISSFDVYIRNVICLARQLKVTGLKLFSARKYSNYNSKGET